MKIFLAKFRNYFLGIYREEQLSGYFIDLIIKHSKSKEIDILDYGSGFNPDLILLLSKKLSDNNFNYHITCVDFYSKENLNELNKNYKQINFVDFKELPKDLNYNFVILSDVLHHVGVDSQETRKILNHLSSISKYIILKDHFEYSFLSRHTLRFMDFIGNYKDGVNIPKNYFTEANYKHLLEELEIESIDIIENIKLYSKILIPFNFSRFQFINLLRKRPQ